VVEQEEQVLQIVFQVVQLLMLVEVEVDIMLLQVSRWTFW
jgi:hypothetical protein